MTMSSNALGKGNGCDLEYPKEVTDAQLNRTETSSKNNALLNAIVIIPD